MTKETNIQFWISMWINPSLCKQMQQTKYQGPCDNYFSLSLLQAIKRIL